MSAHYDDFSTSLIPIKLLGCRFNLDHSLGYLRNVIGVPETYRSSLSDAQVELRERDYAAEESRREQLVAEAGKGTKQQARLDGRAFRFLQGEAYSQRSPGASISMIHGT